MYGGTTREDPEYSGILSIPETVSVSGMNGGTTREDPEYPGILSIPDTVCEVVCMGGQIGRIPSIPGYLLFRTLSVRWYVWGDNSGGSPVSWDT